jgi:hypothetical protein
LLQTARDTGTWEIPASWIDIDMTTRTKLKALRRMAQLGMIELREGNDPIAIITEPYQWPYDEDET